MSQPEPYVTLRCPNSHTWAVPGPAQPPLSEACPYCGETAIVVVFSESHEDSVEP